MHEIAIRGGTLIDGRGGPAVRADLGIRGGRISEIAPTVRGEREIDASGRIVAPGFIDIHTHYDPQVLWDPWLTPSSWHGVTSVVAGNCGYSIAPLRPEVRGTLLRTLDKVEDMPLPTLEAGIDWDFETYGEYLDRIERRGIAIHYGGFVGHTPVRLCVLGEDAYERDATDEEIGRMKTLVAESIEAGALGFSTDRAGFHVGDGGRPVPSMAASQAETEALIGVVGELGRGIVHVAPGERFEWVYDLQPGLGRPLQWSSILSYGGESGAPRDFRPKLARHEAARRAGLDIWVQVTCRPILQEVRIADPLPFYQLATFKELVPLPPPERLRCYADPAWRDRAWQELEHGPLRIRWSTVRVTRSPSDAAALGQPLDTIARERSLTPLDVLCDLAVADGLETRFDVTFANDDEADVSRLLSTEGAILGLSDAGAHVNQICDAVMPTDFLSAWVRDRDLMPVEQGIHKLTGELAGVLGLERGVLTEGAPADLVVLDWEALSPGPIRRVTDLPADGERLVADAPCGIDHVLVNGVPIRSEGRPLNPPPKSLPGTILRSRA
jgi:N-acyl-D-amino-acid deacylase